MITTLIRRNLTLFFRDKSGVFFSLLGPLIMFALYSFFLGDLQKQSLLQMFPASTTNQVTFFVNSWVFAGILLTTAITTSLGAMQIFVADRLNERFKDFAVSPIKRSQLVMGYFGSTLVISFALTLIMFVLGEAYICLVGGKLLSLRHVFITGSELVLICGLFSALAALLVTFLKTAAAFTSVSVIIGTISGFLAGVYVPVGSLPSGVVNVMNVLPFSPVAALIRSSFVAQATDRLTDNPTAISQVNAFYGTHVSVHGHQLSNPFIIGAVVVLTLISATLAVSRLNRQL